MVQASKEQLERLRAAGNLVSGASPLRPKVAVILGSGLAAFGQVLSRTRAIPYRAIPGWPVSTVEGHAGRLLLGEAGGLPVAVMEGRVHLYEGYTPWEVAFPVRVLALAGCRALVVSNAAGAVNTGFAPGDLMLIRDHINLQFRNPCVGPNLEELGPRFFDMTRAYHPPYLELARQAAEALGIPLREGVYAGLLGPSYETPAEIRMLRTLGADAVGMSTVPEVIAAVHAGLRVVGISCLTNMAAGVLEEPLDHREVLETAARVRDSFVALLRELLARIAAAEGWGGPGSPGEADAPGRGPHR